MEKRNKIYISTCNFKKKYDNDLVHILENLPTFHDKFEISSGHRSQLKDFNKILEKKESGYNFLLHNYPLGEENNLLINLSESDTIKRNLIIDYIKKMIDFSYKLENDYFSFHGGWLNEKSVSKDSHKRALDVFIKSLKEINDYAKDRSIKLGIENHVVPKGKENWVIHYGSEDFIQLFQKMNDDNVYLHLDVGHLNVSAETFNFNRFEFMKEFKDRIYAVHIHENKGLNDDHNQIHANSYFLPYLKNFTNLKYTVLETFDIENIDIIKKMMKIIDRSL